MTWLPYELHPEAPPEGIPRDAYFGRARSERMHSHLQSIAESVGLQMESRDVIINSRRALGAAAVCSETSIALLGCADDALPACPRRACPQALGLPGA